MAAYTGIASNNRESVKKAIIHNFFNWQLSFHLNWSYYTRKKPIRKVFYLFIYSASIFYVIIHFMKPVHSSHLYCIKYSFLQKQIFSANSLKTAQPSHLSTLYLDKALFLFVFCRIFDSTSIFSVSTYKKRPRNFSRSLKKYLFFHQKCNVLNLLMCFFLVFLLFFSVLYPSKW